MIKNKLNIKWLILIVMMISVVVVDALTDQTSTSTDFLTKQREGFLMAPVVELQKSEGNTVTLTQRANTAG